MAIVSVPACRSVFRINKKALTGAVSYYFIMFIKCKTLKRQKISKPNFWRQIELQLNAILITFSPKG